ncbi:uncharacterized protein N7483_004657 [Penicillium malachiteum]|uniref:uncharacterized protein n=1 Tax=Penicillium malachiteum TaxID=1324776 RepID=UPI002549497F|nr:uncharacterized protein N7483_004657 [Penicillium malachiteum]KAJ5730149.1 hypothetical protein N7483_004657 [Penicillium malachiteum]
MSNGSFRLESFQLWKPSQEKAQALQDSLDTCRYPSPVSITTTSSPSGSRDPVSTNPNIHSYNHKRHPLPPRPLVEVCMNNGLQHEINTQPQLTVEDQALDFRDTPAPQVSLNLPEIDHVMVCDNLGEVSEQSLGVESDQSGVSGLPCTTSQHSHAGNTGSPVLSGECPGTVIDPQILDDFHSRDSVQTSADEDISEVMSPSRSSDASTHSQSVRLNPQKVMKPGRPQPGRNNLSVVVDNRHRNRIGGNPRADSPVPIPSSRLQDQFSSLPVEAKLEFLSWLFQGAISQCSYTASIANCASASGLIPEDEGTSTLPSTELFPDINVVEHSASSRKGLNYSAEEDKLLIKLRKEQALSWSEVTRRFSQIFPGRKQGSLQVHWNTKIEKKQ